MKNSRKVGKEASAGRCEGGNRKKNVDDRPCFSVMSNTRCHRAHLLRSLPALILFSPPPSVVRIARCANNNNLSAATGNNNGRPGNRYVGFIGFWP